MKIRQDFVTNSSSSSFVVAVAVNTDKEKFDFDFVCEPDLMDALEDSGLCQNFTGSIEKLKDMTDIREMLEYIFLHVDIDDTWSDDDEEDEDVDTSTLEGKYSGHDEMLSNIRSFIDSVVESVQNGNEVHSIVINENYSAWGEFADLITVNDRELQNVAENYLNAHIDEKAEAKAKLIEVLNRPDEERAGEQFGQGFAVVYEWSHDEDDAALEDLARRIVGCDIDDDACLEGSYHYYKYDLKNNQTEQFAVYNIEKN